MGNIEEKSLGLETEYSLYQGNLTMRAKCGDGDAWQAPLCGWGDRSIIRMTSHQSSLHYQLSPIIKARRVVVILSLSGLKCLSWKKW